MKACHLALVGATGIVGREILRVLEEREFPVQDLTLLASVHSEGTRVEFRDRRYGVRLLTQEAFAGVDLAIFAAGPEPSQDYASHAVSHGAVVIDTSSAFRLAPNVPLCVPDLNAASLRTHQGIVAMPHSLTAQMALTLAPLHAAATLKRVVVATYQAVSGLGQRAVQEFDQQLRDVLNFRPPQVQEFPHQIAFNCLPQCGAFLEHGYTAEEMALIHETRRHFEVPELPITATAVCVPLAYGHAAAVTVEMAQPLSADEARARLEQASGVVVEDDYHRLHYPFVTRVNGQDAVFVGRIRADLSVPHGIHLWIVADNMRRGAAVDVVQIAEHLLVSDLLSATK
ncbi:Aspartate-semialdehyde dehydrogenase [Candidatus Entotheonellaceae bacterium PAL068K]